MTCVECGKPLTGRQQRFCSQVCTKRWWRKDAAFAERERAASREWKAAHAEQCARVTKAYRLANGKRCSRCGKQRPRPCGETARGKQGELCRDCRSVVRRERALRICAMWAEGLSLRQIAEAVGWNTNTLGVEMAQLRGEGYDLPLRRPRSV